MQSEVSGSIAAASTRHDATLRARGAIALPARVGTRLAPRASLDHLIGSTTATELRALAAAAETSVAAFERATRRHGSLLQCWIRGRTVVEFDHYPPDDVVDADSGSQYFYHAHRSAHAEHGHLHLFRHVDALGRRIRRTTTRQTHSRKSAWVPAHLIAICLSERGMPVSLFTVNRWVTGGHWFDAARTLALVEGFHLLARGPYPDANRWLSGFVQLYRPVLGPLLAARDRRLDVLARTRARDAIASDRRIEVLSHVAIDWAHDLDALDAERARRAVS